MSCSNFYRVLLPAAVFFAPLLAMADTITRDSADAAGPGEMEYIEVIGEREDDDAVQERERQVRAFKQRQQQRSRLEQVRALQQRQRQLLDKFRAEKEKALATTQDKRRKANQGAARSEEIRREQERSRAEDLRRLEEERLRQEAEVRQQEPS